MGEVGPDVKLVTYEIDIMRHQAQLNMAITRPPAGRRQEIMWPTTCGSVPAREGGQGGAA